MFASGSKLIAILFISVIISSIGVQSAHNKEQVQQNKNTSYEINLLNEILDYNQLHHVIVIYTSFGTSLKHTGCRKNYITDKFIEPLLMRKLTENYHIQFVNSLWFLSREYLFQSSIHRVFVFIKYNSEDEIKKKILQMASNEEKLNIHFVWLILMDSSEDPLLAIKHNFGHFNIMVNADVTVAIQKEHKNFSYDLYDIYKICHYCGSPLEIEYKGNYTAKEGLQILNNFRYSIAVRRNNLKQYALKVATAIINKSPDLNISDLEYLNNDKDRMEEDAMQRLTFQLMNHMLYLYNATFDINIKHSWGAKVNNSWTGVIGLIARNEAEFSICPLRYLLERKKVLDYTSNIHYEKIHFIFRHPKHISIRNIFFEPLADFVWFCVLALIVVMILLLTIHVHIENKIFTKLQGHQKQQQLNISNNKNAGNIEPAGNSTKPLEFHIGVIVDNHFDFIVLCIMEAILMQGPEPQLFRCNSTRLIILSVSIFSILLMQFYGAFIVSSLLSEPPRTITNLQALYNSSLELGMEDVSYNYEVFINNTNPLIHNVYKYRICNKQTVCPNAITLEEGVRRIRSGNFAFHVAIDRAYRLLKSYLKESQLCDLQEIMFNPPFTFYSGLAIRKGSPYYEYINRAIAVFRESALIQYNNKKWEVDKIDCSTIQGDLAEVDLEHFAPALAFLLFAYTLCFLLLFVEITYKKLLNGKIFQSKKYKGMKIIIAAVIIIIIIAIIVTIVIIIFLILNMNKYKNNRSEIEK